jgi:microcompartment protein CcmL/EutN
MRMREIPIDDNLVVSQKLEPGKILVMVLDGKSGKVKITEAVEHGQTVIETHNGKVKRVSFKDDELF